MALETFQFCIGNKKALLNRTNVFGAYFPPLLKLYAWAPALHQYARIHIILPFHVRCFSSSSSSNVHCWFSSFFVLLIRLIFAL